jgi:hypothetical protein
MNVEEKREFIRMMTDAIANKLIRRAAAMPEDWDGYEIRQYLAEEFMLEASRDMRGRAFHQYALQGKRLRAFRIAKARVELAVCCEVCGYALGEGAEPGDVCSFACGDIADGERPLFVHDCRLCTFLGRYNGPEHPDTPARDADLYVCSRAAVDPKKATTVIARFSSEGSEYASGLAFAHNGRNLWLVEAKRRAEERGFDCSADNYEAERAREIAESSAKLNRIYDEIDRASERTAVPLK